MAADPNLTRSYLVKPEEMTNFRELAYKNGLIVPEYDNGEVETHGIKIHFAYDGVTLTLTILSKPFYIPASMIWRELSAYLPA